MEVSSSHQIYVFLLYVALGMLCGAFFDVQRFLRRLNFAGSTRTMLEDILFASVCVCVMIGLGYYFNNGEIRYYQVMGAVSGALFYAAVLSRIFMKILFVIFKVIKNLVIKPVVKICVLLLIPIKKLWAILKKIGHKSRRITKAFVRNIKKRKKHLKKRIKML